MVYRAENVALEKSYKNEGVRKDRLTLIFEVE